LVIYTLIAFYLFLGDFPLIASRFILSLRFAIYSLESSVTDLIQDFVSQVVQA